ncbi:MAG: thiamine pyrophosphate-dependent dehydrogenase E1 component subunit alpha [Chloroflexi bacterium]|nr:thiamine pyrophosphate-dependent dehydrogenase E1 component subunit alpha [Chloroflexota bacterium]
MVRIRKFEEKVADLVSNNEIICPCHLYIGQEAVAAGVCAALQKQDWVFSTHRSHGHYIAKGGDIRSLLAEMYGRETGCSRGKGGSMHISSPEMGLPGSCAIVGGTIPLAVGTALSFTLQGKDAVAVSFFGDGATNEGVWYESLNFASLRRLPVIFVCENNLYSTHLSISDCLAETNISRKAEALGTPAVRVDGNNVIEVYEEATKAVEGARRGCGPALIECLTYRWRGHVGPNYDLDKGLRSKEELDHWMERCPIKAMERLLSARGLMSEPEMVATYEGIEREIDEALAYAKESPCPDEARLLADVFKC